MLYSDDENIQKEYNKSSKEEREELYNLFKKYSPNTELSSDEDIVKAYRNMKKVVYKNGIAPPTPQQFLDPAYGWLPKSFTDDIRDWVREDFIEILSGKKQYNQIVQYSATRCEAKGTKILMADLSVKSIEDVIEGDLLMGDDSKPRKVLSLHRGYGKLYKVKQASGDDYYVNEDHVLVLYDLIKKNEVEITVKNYLNLDDKYMTNLVGVKALLPGIDPPHQKYSFISIDYCKDGDYYGFELDGNHRYLHSDLTITHNTGKSFFVILMILYTIVYCHHLRDVCSYFGVAQTTTLCLYILSFKYDKVYEIYLKKLFQIMQKNDRFVMVKRQDDVKKKQEELGQDYIVYSKASLVGEITLASDIQIICGNDDALAVIGSDILQAYVSEIAFFIENAGATEEQIFRLYSDTVQRINNTVGETYLAYTYLDTSPNNSESSIENYILKTLKHEPDVFFRQRSQWEVKELCTKNFKTWLKTGETFKVCTGNGQYPPKIINNKEELIDIPKDLIINVPIDALRAFTRNLNKSIKDIAGIPTSSENKFISNTNIIDNLFNNPSLPNVIQAIVCDVKEENPHLLWDTIVNIFFTKYNEKDYVLKRAPREARYVGVDLAFSAFGDVASVSMMHREWSRDKNCVIYVTDFNLTIAPGENGINLGCITQFLIDLSQKGRVFVHKGAVDTFQSRPLIQTLESKNIEIVPHSNLKDLETHFNLLNELLSHTIKCGKNIFLKNNLNSLYRSKDKNGRSERITHSDGKDATEIVYNGDWEKSDCGLHHDDNYVSFYQAFWVARLNDTMPGVVYEDMNRKFGYIELSEKDVTPKKDQFKNLIQDSKHINEDRNTLDMRSEAKKAYMQSLPPKIKVGSFNNLIRKVH